MSSDPTGRHSNATHSQWQGCLTAVIWSILIVGAIVLIGAVL